MLGNLLCICCHLRTFFKFNILKNFKFNILKKIYQEHYHNVKHLVLDQDRHSVGPDLGPHCLHWLSADDKNHR